MGRQPGVDLPDRRARADPDPGSIVEHLDGPELPAGVGQDAVGDALPTQAGAPRPERQRGALGRAGREQPADLPGVRGRHHRRRCHREMRGVVGHAEPVAVATTAKPRSRAAKKPADGEVAS